MQICSLFATKPLRKVLTRGQTQPYPMVSHFTSEVNNVKDCKDLLTIVKSVSDRNGCLLKGVLDRPLSDESRAGHTSPDTPTEWVCIDVDGLPGYTSPEDFMTKVGLGDVTFVFQYSASHGRKPGLNCHIFFLLDEPVAPSKLKNWLQVLSTSYKATAAHIRLQASKVALKMPVDMSACQNDKLIYVARPAVEDGAVYSLPEEQRIGLVSRSRERATVMELSPAAHYTVVNPSVLGPGEASVLHIPSDLVCMRERARIVNELRAKEDLPPRHVNRFKTVNGVAYYPNPDPAKEYQTKSERGFVYLNLNGGDSWGYYFPEDHIEYVYNFKGEPVYRLADLIPDLYQRLMAQRMMPTDPAPGMQNATTHPLLFSSLEDGVCAGEFDAKNQAMKVARRISKEAAHSFAAKHQIVFDPKTLPLGSIQYRPDLPPGVTEEDGMFVVNTFVPSEVMTRELVTQSAPPPTTDRFIRRMMSGDEDLVKRFYHWLAWIVQYRTKTMTAWIFTGVQGSGKGTLFKSVFVPLLGRENAREIYVSNLEEKYNTYMKESLLLMVDEVSVDEHAKRDEIKNRLKSMITEEYVSVRAMHRDAVNTKTYSSFVLASNDYCPMVIEASDRRYFVPEYVKDRLDTSDAIHLVLEAETPRLYGYLMGLDIDHELVMFPPMTAAKKDMIQMSATDTENLLLLLQNGDLKGLMDHLPEPGATVSYMMRATVLEALPTLMKWLEQDEVKITISDFATLHTLVTGKSQTSFTRLNRMLRRIGINLHGRSLNVTWKTTAAERKKYAAQLKKLKLELERA